MQLSAVKYLTNSIYWFGEFIEMQKSGLSRKYSGFENDVCIIDRNPEMPLK
jgi:hypothetical protein